MTLAAATEFEASFVSMYVDRDIPKKIVLEDDRKSLCYSLGHASCYSFPQHEMSQQLRRETRMYVPSEIGDQSEKKNVSVAFFLQDWQNCLRICLDF